MRCPTCNQEYQKPQHMVMAHIDKMRSESIHRIKAMDNMLTKGYNVEACERRRMLEVKKYNRWTWVHRMLTEAINAGICLPYPERGADANDG